MNGYWKIREMKEEHGRSHLNEEIEKHVIYSKRVIYSAKQVQWELNARTGLSSSSGQEMFPTITRISVLEDLVAKKSERLDLQTRYLEEMKCIIKINFDQVHESRERTSSHSESRGKDRPGNECLKVNKPMLQHKKVMDVRT